MRRTKQAGPPASTESGRWKEKALGLSACAWQPSMERWQTRLLSSAWPTALLVVGVFAVGYAGIAGTGKLVDEYVHSEQVEMFASGEFDLHSLMTMVPGYHFLLSVPAAAFGTTSIVALRGYTLLLSLFTVFAFTANTWERSLVESRRRTLQFAFMPILFPFFFLVYTDVFSLGLVLAAFCLVRQKKRFAGGVVGWASMFVRQHNVIWMAFFVVYDYLDEHETTVSPSKVLQHLKKCWLFVAAGTAFVVFVCLNGGVAIGDQTAHPLKLRGGNLYFCLFVVCLVFMPLYAANWRRIAALLLDRRVLVGLGIAFLLYMLEFRNRHHYNHEMTDYFLRNWILTQATATPLSKALFFVPVAFGFLLLAAVPLRKPADYALFVFAVLALLPALLIEQRYYLVPFALWMLLRQQCSDRVERALIAYFAVLSLAIFIGISSGRVFL